MAFLQRRLFSTGIRLHTNFSHYNSYKPSLAYPFVTPDAAMISNPEVQQLVTKAKGPWKDLSMEETVRVYRTTFPTSFKESKKSEGHYRIVVPLVIAGVCIGYVLEEFLKKTVGPKPPVSYNNPEWEAATLEMHLRNKANPITGLSSKEAIARREKNNN